MKKGNIQIGFQLASIKTEQFAVIESNYNPKKAVDISTQIEFKLDSSNTQLGVFSEFEFTQGKQVFLKIQVSCHFIIDKDAIIEFTNNDNSSIIFPKGFLAHLAMLTVGTTRGVLFAKTENSQFSKFILPTINVTEMIPEDVSFQMEEAVE